MDEVKKLETEDSMENAGHENPLHSWDMLKDSLFLAHTNSFIVEYNMEAKQCYVDPAQKKYVEGDWAKMALQPKQDYRTIALQQDVGTLTEFFDFSGLERGGQRMVTVRLRVKKHRYEWFRISLVCYGDGCGKRVLITFSNIQNETMAMAKMEFLLTSDPLTHLPNRDTFMEQTRQMLEQNPNQHYSIIYMDVEKFHIINQLYGTEEGDNILRYIGVKLQECIEATGSGTYCRIMGDIFCICLPAGHGHDDIHVHRHTHASDCLCVEDNQGEINTIIHYIQSALKAYPVNFDINISFGIYTTEHDTAQNVSVQSLVDRAKAAQRTVKNNYHKFIAFYDQNLLQWENEERMIISEMRDALEQRQFQMYLQPKCEMETGRIVGSEALVRWIHPAHGMISPGKFIPVFENNGFISEVDHYIVQCACEAIRSWLDKGLLVQPISVNISRMDLYNPKLIDEILNYVKEYRIPHELIEFELTESAFVSDSHQFSDFADALRENQFAILMDDFGSGYSSLNSLRELPVDVLKLDLKFLTPSQDDERANIILRSIINMAGKLGIDTIVEGVEELEQAKFILSTGCKNAQGFYFYRPMPANDFEQLMAEKPLPLSMRAKKAG